MIVFLRFEIKRRKEVSVFEESFASSVRGLLQLRIIINRLLIIIKQHTALHSFVKNYFLNNLICCDSCFGEVMRAIKYALL